MSYLKLTEPFLRDLSHAKEKEVLLVNELGAYCSTTISMCNTRKYHGLLAVHQPKIDDQWHILLASLDESILTTNSGFSLAVHQYPGVHFPEGQQYLQSMTYEAAPRWVYEMNGIRLEKELVLSKNENRLLIKYYLAEAKGTLKLQLRPFLAYRNAHTLRQVVPHNDAEAKQLNNGIEFSMFNQYEPLFFQHSKKGAFVTAPDWYHNIEYQKEKERGYEYNESLFVPGYFEFSLKKGEEFIFSVGLRETNPRMLKRDFQKEKNGWKTLTNFEDCLVNASEQFIMRHNDRTIVVAGWPWFGPWGRDTFIALPGLTLTTDKTGLFKGIIDSAIRDLRRGLFPNVQTSYNSADAPLWFIWALQQYAYHTSNLAGVWEEYGSYLRSILESYRDGTDFNIKARDNGLIWAGDPNYALTWMDAIVDGYPVTPRIGMPVEINALWFNAIYFSLEAAEAAQDNEFIKNWDTYPDKLESAFVDTFWNEGKGYLADYVDDSGAHWEIRPNQIFAVSLPYSPLQGDMDEAVIKIVEQELLTPRGLRTLSPSDPSYKGSYGGDQPNRDRAYHQGTVWPWLLGHYAEACLKVRGKNAVKQVEKLYKGLEPAVVECALGTIPEVYSGDAPHKPGGAIAQAWSVAEALRMKQLINLYKTSKPQRRKRKTTKIKELQD